MGPWPWRGAWTALVRCGHATYTAPVLPRGRIFTKQAVGRVADGSGFMADLSTLKVNSKLVSRAGAPVPANGPSEIRLVEEALAARCGHKCPTWLRRHAASITLARRDQIQYEETMSWRSAEVAANLGGGGVDRAPYNCPAMIRASKEDEVLFEDLFGPAFDGLKVLFEDSFAFDSKSQTNNLKCRSFIVSTVCAPSRLLPEKLGGNLQGFHYICNLADATVMNAELCCEKQFNKLDLGPPNFDSIYGTALAHEVNCWQIRCLTKAPQAAGAIHTDFERGFMCAEDMLLDLSDASKGSIEYIHSTILKLQVHDPSFSTLIYQRKLLNKMFSSSHILSELQCYRFFSSRKQRKSLKQFKDLKARNRGILCLDDGFDEILLSFKRIIAQMRQYSHDYGKCVDVSERYGPGCEVYTAGLGSFHATIQHYNESFDMSFSARDLYSRAWRSKLGTFVMAPDLAEWLYITDEDHKTLTFTSSYTYGGLGGDDVKDTWIGVDALRHAFHVIRKSDGSPTDLLKQAIKIISIHLSESARLQSVFETVCESMTDVTRTTLDVEPAVAAGAARPIRTHTPSFWVENYGHYSKQAMIAVDKYITENEEYTIENAADGQVKSPEEIFREIRVLSRDVYCDGVFADKVGDPPLEPPRESPPDVTGYEVEFPYLLLNEWGTGMSR